MSQIPVRRRLSADERRRQLVGIGLAKIVETPIQDLPMDDIAAEAGISRGLLFHYFPTKTDFYLACIAAAGRRMLRTTAPNEDDPGAVQVETMARLMIEQIERRRAFYLTLVHGHGTGEPRAADVFESVRTVTTYRVMTALGLEPASRPVVRAWWAYLEDRALSWSGTPPEDRAQSLDELTAEGVAALGALLAVSGG